MAFNYKLHGAQNGRKPCNNRVYNHFELLKLLKTGV